MKKKKVTYKFYAVILMMIFVIASLFSFGLGNIKLGILFGVLGLIFLKLGWKEKSKKKSNISEKEFIEMQKNVFPDQAVMNALDKDN